MKSSAHGRPSLKQRPAEVTRQTVVRHDPDDSHDHIGYHDCHAPSTDPPIDCPYHRLRRLGHYLGSYPLVGLVRSDRGRGTSWDRYILLALAIGPETAKRQAGTCVELDLRGAPPRNQSKHLDAVPSHLLQQDGASVDIYSARVSGARFVVGCPGRGSSLSTGGEVLASEEFWTLHEPGNVLAIGIFTEHRAGFRDSATADTCDCETETAKKTKGWARGGLFAWVLVSLDYSYRLWVHGLTRVAKCLWCQPHTSGVGASGKGAQGLDERQHRRLDVVDCRGQHGHHLRLSASSETTDGQAISQTHGRAGDLEAQHKAADNRGGGEYQNH